MEWDGMETDGMNMDQTNNSDPGNRRFNLSITYNFETKNEKARNIDGAANEIKTETGN